MPSRAIPRGPRWPPPADIGLAGVVAVLTLVGFGVSVVADFPFLMVDHDAQRAVPAWQAILEVMAETLPLVFRRAAPTAVFVLVAGASLVDEALNRHPEPLPLAVLVALYTLAVCRRPLVAGIAGAGYVVGLGLDVATAWTDVSDDQLYVDLLAVVGTVSLGCWICLDRARAAAAERRALEATRDAVDRERTRIAREMHDVLGHQLTVIVAQAATSRRVHTDRPQATAEALGSIESVGRDALSGLRRVVGGLNTEPGLDRLPALVQEVRRAGLAVRLVVVGQHRRLAAEVEANAYRIAQEALTNSLRHNGRSAVTVTVTYGSDALRIDVAERGNGHPDDGARQADAPPGGGTGLAGMRQRAEMLGGELTAARDDTGGFSVRAWLPVAEPADRMSG